MVAFESTEDEGGDLMGVQHDLIDDFLVWLCEEGGERDLDAFDHIWDLKNSTDRQALINEWAKARHTR